MNVLDRLDDEAKKEFWASLALRYCEGMTPRLLAKILRYYQTAYAAYESLTADRNVLGLGMGNLDAFAKKVPQHVRLSLKNDTWREKALKEWQEAQKTDCDVVLRTDYRYPLALKYLVDAPAFFYAKGNLSLLSSPTLAIVGSRKPHEKAVQHAEIMAEELSSLGLCIVSGMALGIDKSAHLGALRGQGKTIAVLGTGINVVYPRQHGDLYAEIAENGLLVSEFSPFTQPAAQNFPIRNRLITGISEGVLIVEAGLKSGSLITARLALEQNKNVYVCEPLNAGHSLGGQKLLEEGAVPAKDCQTLIADLVPDLMARYEILCQQKEQKSAEEFQKLNAESECVQKKSVSSANSEQHLPIEKSVQNGKTEQREIKNPGTEQRKEGQKSVQSRHVPIKSFAEKTQESNAVNEHETAIYAPYLKKEENKRKSQIFLNRPKLEEELKPLPLDFGLMAQDILQKENMQKKLGEQKSKSRPQKNAKIDVFSEQADEGSKKDLEMPKNTAKRQGQKSVLPDTDSAVIPILLEHESLTADEILQCLNGQGADTNMAALSAELLLLEVEGSIEKLAGGRYRICYE